MILTFLKWVVLWLEPSYTFPTQRLNYHKSVEAIMSQSIKGRQSFYSILFSKATEEDKRYIFDKLLHDTRRTTKPKKAAVITV
jgi:hypothetical protein